MPTIYPIAECPPELMAGYDDKHAMIYGEIEQPGPAEVGPQWWKSYWCGTEWRSLPTPGREILRPTHVMDVSELLPPAPGT